MRLHALVEMLVGPVLVVAALVLPTILGDKREFFLVMGLVILVVWFVVKLRSSGRSSSATFDLTDEDSKPSFMRR